MTRHSRRAVLFSLVLLTGIIVCAGLSLRAERRQDALDRQLIAALVKSDVVQALALVKQGADPNTSYTPPSAPTLRYLFSYLFHRSSLPCNDSPTAILIACGAHWNEGNVTLGNFRDAPQLVQTMLERGANIEAKDQEARTPLLWAIENDNPQTVRLLLQYGAYVNAKSKDGETPLIEMCRGRSSENVRMCNVGLLIEHGADTNAKSKDGETPLQAACTARSSENVRVLLEHGANPNALNDNGTSMLYFAVMSSSPSPEEDEAKDIISQLLKYGADPNLTAKGVSTALELAQDIQRPDIMALLRQHGAKK